MRLVLGSDSVVNAIYGGKLRWFWGDTNRRVIHWATSTFPGDVVTCPETADSIPNAASI